MSRHMLGSYEELILLAVRKLKENAIGVRILELLQATYRERDFTIGAVYTTLERLEKKGFLISHEPLPRPVRGGRRTRRYNLTENATKQLSQLENVRSQLRNGTS